MAPFYQKPENAVKRADELVAVQQHSAALGMLYEVAMSKRGRTAPPQVLSAIVAKCLELAVALGKSRIARDILYQYKNILQNVTVTPIETAVRRFLELAEAKLADAQAKADKLTLDTVDDLDAIETPESILLSAVSALASKDRTDRAIVAPWLRFLWEAFRSALDVLKNNSRLEHIYHFVAGQAIAFCTRYERKTEFRRLCDTMRYHLSSASKPSGNQIFPINLDDPDTLQRHLTIRFIQLNAAAELEHWQEGFRTIEDIHNLIQISNKPPKPIMMATYYERLARIFLVGENYLFHAAAMNKYYSIMRQNKDLSPEEHERIASLVLLSAMAVPIISSSDFRSFETEETKARNQRLTALLHFQQVPTRESLIREALGATVFPVARSKIRDLYKLLEVDFHPLSISKSVVPIIASFEENVELKRYTKRLHDAVLTRLLQQLAQVYTTVKIDFVVKLASFPEPHTMDAYDIERFIMNGCKRGEFSIRMDHSTNSIVFVPDVLSGVPVMADGSPFGASNLDAEVAAATGMRVMQQPTDMMRVQLSHLARCLYSILPLISPGSVEEMEVAKSKAFAEAAARMEEERQATFMRRALIEKQKEMREHETAEREREEQRLRLERIQREQAAEKARLEEEARRREIERMEQQRKMIEKQEAARLAERLADELRDKNVDFDKAQLANMDKSSLVQLQLTQLEKERRELALKIKTLAKRNDHIERAFRKEEIPLLHEDFEKQQVRDLEAHKAACAARLEAAREKHKVDMILKARLTRMVDDYRILRESMQKQRDEEYGSRIAESKRLIAEAKEKRIAEAREKFESEKERRATEAAERARREEEERERLAQEAAAEEERKREQEARRTEEAERIRKADEVARRQREREAEIEKRREQERARPNASVSDKWRPSTQPGSSSETAPNWRERAKASEPVPPPPEGPKKYVPPMRSGSSAAVPPPPQTPAKYVPPRPSGSGSAFPPPPPSGPRAGAASRSGHGSSEMERSGSRDRPSPATPSSTDARFAGRSGGPPVIGGGGKWRERMKEKEEQPDQKDSESGNDGFEVVKNRRR